MYVSIEEALKILKNGDLVAIPTETVYGLAACYDNPSAIQKIFSIKGRPSNNPLILHLSCPKEASIFIKQEPPCFKALTDFFWPGPLTLIVPALTEKLDPMIRAGLSTIALRIPSHPETLSLLKKTGPLVAPSANLSTRPSSTRYQHIVHDFGNDFPVLVGQEPGKGVESTILAFNGERWEIAREGACCASSLCQVLGYLPVKTATKSEKPLCPGQCYRHYSPRKKLITSFESAPSQGDLILGYSDRNYTGALIYDLGSSSNPEEIAYRLYDGLRQIDQDERVLRGWIDMDLPQTDEFSTLLERMKKASQK